MNNLIEIRWHGRGGQGAKTASLLLADAAFNTGKYIQGFPEYGPERMGAPITAYNRISDKPITIHSNIYEPDYVVVVDDTLLESVPVTAGLKKEGAIVINTTKSPEYLKEKLNGYDGNIYTIDARKVSEETLGKYFPNTPMLAAIEKMTEINKETPMKDLTIGGNIYCAGNAREFKTGDWRSMKPVWDEEKCKQCGLCFAVCPENSIPVGKDCKRTETDFDYCKGCGVCAQVCPFKAIEMKVE